jgi:DNA-binding NtrC family response regulator
MDLFTKLRDMKILLIDDDEWIRDSLTLYLESEGCHLLALETAEEGIKAVRQQTFDIVISDYKLPGMDGLDFLKRVHKYQPQAKEILITAYGSKEVVAQARTIGVLDYIEKPFTSENIENSLRRLIEND